MGSNINAGGGGGVHPGAPMIWPQSKKVQQTTSTEESQSSSRQVASKSSAASTATSAAAKTAEAKAPTKSVETPSTRPMAMGDIVDQLVKLNIPTTSENRQLASYMMQHGVELSYDSFGELFRLLKGRGDKQHLESAVVSLSKGLTGLGRSVDVLATFFAKQIQLTQKAQQMQSAIANFQANLGSGKGLDSGLLSGIASALTLIDEELKQFRRSGKGDSLRALKSGSFVKNLSVFSQFLNGVEQQYLVNRQDKKSPFYERLSQLKSSVYDVLDSVLAQSILSKDAKHQDSSLHEKFFYWVFPNPFDSSSDMDILIRKDPRDLEDIDPKRTRLVVRLDTPDVGEITIMIDILDNQVWYVFNSEREETQVAIADLNQSLTERLKELDFRLAGFKSIHKKIDINEFLLPRSNLDQVVRIQVDV